MHVNALERAIEITGGQSALARAIGGNVKQAHVWHWLRVSKGRVPAEHCTAIEVATEGRVSRHDLRPDIYSAEDTAKATDGDEAAGAAAALLRNGATAVVRS